ncbi:MAG: hypothetical protein FJZ89_03005 [Chloroflexi bacterium]|nr:hypothetical protein [Chloroflexota bacterium]
MFKKSLLKTKAKPATPPGLTSEQQALVSELASRLAAEPQDLLAEIGQQPRPVAPALLARLAQQGQAPAVPLLELAASGSDGDLALAAIEALGTVRATEAAQALQRLAAAGGDKARLKAARRSLYRLSQLGVSVTPATPAPAPAPAFEEPVVAAMASPYDGVGTQLVLVVRQNRWGDLRLAVFLLCDEEGVKECFGLDPCSKKDWQRQREWATEEAITMTEVGLSACRWLIEQAQEISQSSGGELPAEFDRWQRLLESGQAQPWPAELSPDHLHAHPELLAESKRLVKAEECQGWLPDENLDKYAEEMNEAATQDADLPVVDLEAVQAEGAVVNRVVQELFQEKLKERFQRRLQGMAAYFWGAGRQQEAQWAAASALALAEGSVPVVEHPFLWESVYATLRTIAKMKEDLERQHEAAARRRSGGLALPRPPQPPPEPEGYQQRPSGLIVPK